MVGTRGIPNILGGIETHCQNIYPALAILGVNVLLVRRSAYTKDSVTARWKKITLVDSYAPKIKGLEALVHTLFAVPLAIRFKPDIVHLHGIGPALITPIFKLAGFSVIVTHHGFDYDRANWGRFAKLILRVGEYFAAKFSDGCIAISRPIAEKLQSLGARECRVIFNGVRPNDRLSSDTYLVEMGLEKHGYILAVARFVPEKGLHDLIQAYAKSSKSLQLVIAGDADFESTYKKQLVSQAARVPGVKLTGFVTGKKLAELYSHAQLFVLPSYHEGLPIALLEAMSYGVTPLVSDIPANTEVPLPRENFFPVGNVDVLASRMDELSVQVETSFSELVDLVKVNYDWDSIARDTLNFYKDVSGLRAGSNI